MSGRYHNTAKEFSLSTNVAQVFAYTREGVPHEDVQLWIVANVNISVGIQWADTDGIDWGTPIAANYTTPNVPTRVWTVAGILPSLFAPKASLTITSGTGKAIVKAVWTARTFQPNG